ncbi:hypothetical protein GCM10022393_26170 [Aquimarina addita]|uniref:Uncharacterized protein n=1 Tax=Aquimarina addita TaxID=870485 RepID=A0ABP6UP64_9FLAO
MFSIKNEINKNDFKLFINHLSDLKLEGQSLHERSYSSILTEAQKMHKEEINSLEKQHQEKVKNEKLALEQKQKEEDEEEIAREKEKMQLICSGKWGVYYTKPRYLEVNPDLSESAKKLANTAFDVDPKVTWYIFNEDGTCQIMDDLNDDSFRRRKSNKVIQRSWKLDGHRIIFPYGKNNDVSTKRTIFEILTLESEKFEVIEIDEGYNITLKSETKMVKLE